MNVWASCYDVAKYLNKEFNCCCSCHNEDEDGYFDLLEDYGDYHECNKDWILRYCCNTPKLTNNEYKKLFELKIKDTEDV